MRGGILMNHHMEKEQGLKRVESVLIVGVIAILLLVVIAVFPKESNTSVDQVRELSEGWYYLADGEEKPVQLPAKIKVREGGPLVLYNDSLTDEQSGMTVTTRGAQYDLKVMFRDEVLYEYEDDPFPRNIQMKSKQDCDVVLPSRLQGGMLSFLYSGSKDETYDINAIYIGSGAAVTWHHFVKSSINLVIIILMNILALVAIGIAIYLKHVRLYDRRFIDVAVFLLLCALWSATDSSLIQQNIPFPAVFRVVSFYSFMLFSVPMLHFVRNTGDMKKYRTFDVLILLFYLNAIAQGLLNYLHVFEFIDMLFVTHLLLSFGVAITSVLLVREYKQHKDRELKSILWAFVSVGASGVLAMALYWILEIAYYEVFFQCGILIFVVILFAMLLVTMAGNIKFKIETYAYRRLEREDRLTGMMNRRAFDEFLRQMQEEQKPYKNAALVFMNLNYLRKTNNSFGYNAGDELIIATAKCIENTFGKEGKCFRLSGGEFCTVLLEPKGTEQEWFAKLDIEIQRYNRSSRHKISLARGMSYLWDEEGHRRTVSDWKYQADKKMYEDKCRRRKV